MLLLFTICANRFLSEKIYSKHTISAIASVNNRNHSRCTNGGWYNAEEKKKHKASTMHTSNYITQLRTEMCTQSLLTQYTAVSAIACTVDVDTQ